MAKQKKDEKEDLDDEEGSLKDFICDEDDSGKSSDSDIQVGATIRDQELSFRFNVGSR